MINKSVLILFLMITVSACDSSGDPKVDGMLNSYESFIKDYESLAQKSPLCASDVQKITVEIAPKLQKLTDDVLSMQSNSTFTDSQRTRYRELSARFAVMGTKLAVNMSQIDSSC